MNQGQGYGHGQVHVVVAKTNVQAMVGFWMAVGSYLTCGVLGIPALIVSALGARQEPKGWAIAGICVSIPSVLWSAFWLVTFGLGTSATALSGLANPQSPQVNQAKIDARVIQPVAELYVRGHAGTVCPSPAQLRSERELSPASKTVDPWGSAYVIRCETSGTRVASNGPDRKPNTPDDIVVP